MRLFCSLSKRLILLQHRDMKVSFLHPPSLERLDAFDQKPQSKRSIPKLRDLNDDYHKSPEGTEQSPQVEAPNCPSVGGRRYSVQRPLVYAETFYPFTTRSVISHPAIVRGFISNVRSQKDKKKHQQLW